MTIDELIELSSGEQEAWLNGQLAEGKTPEDIYAALGTDKTGIGKVGIFYVPPKKAFMIKPMRGYQTTRLSGNEKADDAGIIGGKTIK
ncbi:MAG: hypothetical protein LBQ16_07485 [Gracilibacteraceae bacterium]|jgi:hypothetical protein|nr:hypothetical protein [Gracilibacteraceae bacterium]